MSLRAIIHICCVSAVDQIMNKAIHNYFSLKQKSHQILGPYLECDTDVFNALFIKNPKPMNHSRYSLLESSVKITLDHFTYTGGWSCYARNKNNNSKYFDSSFSNHEQLSSYSMTEAYQYMSKIWHAGKRQ